MIKKYLLFLISACSLCTVYAQNTNPPAMSSVREEDLKADLYKLADVHFKGRSAGTLDELKSAVWMADQYRKIGLKPAGEDGTYFQFFNLWRNVISDRSSVEINHVKLNLWTDVQVAQMANV